MLCLLTSALDAYVASVTLRLWRNTNERRNHAKSKNQTVLNEISLMDTTKNKQKSWREGQECYPSQSGESGMVFCSMFNLIPLRFLHHVSYTRYPFRFQPDWILAKNWKRSRLFSSRRQSSHQNRWSRALAWILVPGKTSSSSPCHQDGEWSIRWLCTSNQRRGDATSARVASHNCRVAPFPRSQLRRNLDCNRHHWALRLFQLLWPQCLQRGRFWL